MGRSSGKEVTVELRVRINNEAKQALELMAVSPNKQGALLSELLIAANAEYERLKKDPNSPPGTGVSFVLRKALDAKKDQVGAGT